MSAGFLELSEGERLAVDDKGYLLDWSHWSPAVAEAMAAIDSLLLTPDLPRR